MKETCPDRGKLLLLLAGELSDENAREVEAHIGSCSACEEAASALRGVTGALLRARRRGASALSTESGATRVGGGCPGAETLAGYIDGSLEEEAAADVEGHITKCAACMSEVADLWSVIGPPDRDAPDSAAASALARLEAEATTAVVLWAKRSLKVVRGFASGLIEEMSEGLRTSPDPAPALARSSTREVALRWRSKGGVEFVGIVRDEGEELSLTGRLTTDGVRAAAASVALSSELGARGPESLDADGRFGPWSLGPGDNILRLTGLPVEAGGAAKLVVRLEKTDDSVE